VRSAGRTRALLLLAASTLLPAGCDRAMSLAVGIDTTPPRALLEQLSRPERPLVLDTRPAGDFPAGHIPGALSLPGPRAALRYVERAPVPRSRPIVVVCRRGRSSVEIAAALAGMGSLRVASLEGGMERWRALGLPLEEGAAPLIDRRLVEERATPLALRDQVVAVFSGLGEKPTYMLLALALALLLRRHRAPDLVLIRWSMWAFFVGEGICALNFLAASGASVVLDLLHGLGMVVMGALLPYGLFVFLDDRVLRLSDPAARCVLQRVCGRCIKHEAVACAPKRLFLFAAPALAITSLLPLTRPLAPRSFVTTVFSTPTDFSHGLELLLVEHRVYPLLAFVVLLVATALLLGGQASIRRARTPFFIGLGLGSYALLRFFLFETFRDSPTTADLWEETTELFAILGTAVFLFCFRGPLGLGLGRPRPPRDGELPCESATSPD
jgi:rhodanese-related sulfurtransferase